MAGDDEIGVPVADFCPANFGALEPGPVDQGTSTHSPRVFEDAAGGLERKRLGRLLHNPELPHALGDFVGVVGLKMEDRFENDEIVFYQMNGLMLGTWGTPALEQDMNRFGLVTPGTFALAHNVPTQDHVEPVMQSLIAAGGRLLRAADAPVHGGYRGYVADPDDHAWEIAWNPGWTIDADGHVTFGL